MTSIFNYRVFILLIFLMSSSFKAWSLINVTIYVDDSYPPYSYQENHQAKGIYIDFLSQAVKHLKDYKVDFQTVSWKRGLLMLEKNDIFALAPPYYRTERKYIKSYSLPLFTEEVVVFCNKHYMNSKRTRFPDDFINAKIGVNTGFGLSDILEKSVTPQ